MNRILYIIAVILVIGACKKQAPSIDPSVPLNDRIPGLWDVTKVEYTGSLPFGGGYLPFSGEGQNVSGYFQFTKDPNWGEFQIGFVAVADIGLGTPLSYPVSEGHQGNWKAIDNDRYIRMWSDTIVNSEIDSMYDWEVLHNTQNKQILKSSFVFDFGGQYDSIPVAVKATLER